MALTRPVAGLRPIGPLCGSRTGRRTGGQRLRCSWRLRGDNRSPSHRDVRAGCDRRTGRGPCHSLVTVRDHPAHAAASGHFAPMRYRWLSVRRNRAPSASAGVAISGPGNGFSASFAKDRPAVSTVALPS